MADWQQVVQSVVLGFIFSFLLAKLFSVIFSFRDDDLRIVRSHVAESMNNDSKPAVQGEPPKSVESSDGAVKAETGSIKVDNETSEAVEKERLSSEILGLGESDDDWEGVESTELDEEFSAATSFVAATAADRSSSQKVSNDVQLQLYGLYKIATEGPCSAPQPSALKMTARAKWQAWQKLGAMPTEEAMQNYIAIVTELYPSWAIGHAVSRGSSSRNVPTTESEGPMGPVFSTLVYEEGSGNELKMDAIHAFAREGDEESLRKCIETGVSVNKKDSEGRTPLHWAVDRGQLKITELLVSRNADVNAQDNEGQTPLHYAAVCERLAIAEFLVKQNADMHLKDNDGNSACDLCESSWPFMPNEASVTD